MWFYLASLFLVEDQKIPLGMWTCQSNMRITYLLLRKPLLDFPGLGKIKKGLSNEFYLCSLSHVTCLKHVLNISIGRMHCRYSWKKTHQRALRENLFTFRMYIVSLPWSTSYPKSIFLSIMNHFHIHWTLKLLFRLVIKNTFLRQQIWKTKACAQYLHSCKTFFFYNYEENLHQVRNRRLMKSLFVLLLFTVIKQTWGLKCCYSKRY